MTSKKKAINISILMILISIVIMLLVKNVKQAHYWAEIVFSVMSGICGSCFAVLWIFICEYLIEKERLLQEIFILGVEIKDRLPWFNDLVENNEVLLYLQGKPYTHNLYHQEYESLSPEEKAYFEVCRFADQMLNVSSKRVEQFWSDICEVDFWSDNLFTKCFRKQSYSEIIRNTFSPVYWSLTTASTFNNGYNFQMLYDFQNYGYHDAANIYGLQKDMISNTKTAMKSVGTELPNLAGFLYEKLWIFRAAFCKNNDRLDKKDAISAFIKGTPYKRLR